MEWTDRLLVQLCYWGWPAVIAVTAAAWLLLVATIGLMNATGAGSAGAPGTPGRGSCRQSCSWPICGQYQFRASTVVGLALAMTAANGWARTPIRRPSLRLVLFLMISAAVVLRCWPGVLQFRGVLW